MEHLSRQRLESGLRKIRESPADRGRVILVVRRPAAGVRELADEAMLDVVTGLAGDNWLTRGSSSRTDGSADPERQVTVMNARAAELVAGGTDRMPLAGDQIYAGPRPQRRQSPGRQPARGRAGCASGQRR